MSLVNVRPSPEQDVGKSSSDIDPLKALESLPIVVDLDETLILIDSLHEHAAVGLFTKPLGLLRASRHLLYGRAALKRALATEVDFSCATLPLREDLLEWLRDQANKGREIHLCSAANQALVDAVSRRVGIFTSAIGSHNANLKEKAKAEHLAMKFPNGFVYAGDHRCDLAIWKVARGVILAGASPSVSREARDLGKPIEAEFKNSPFSLKDAVKAFRMHHWSKNALIFVPLILGHAWTETTPLIQTFLGLACLLMVTSATYLVNDIADLDADRRHWSKRNRALASGRLPVAYGFVLAVVLLVLGSLGAFLLSAQFALALGIYLALTLAYSIGLKSVPLLDTLIIGILFTARLVMGIALLGQPYSEWLLTFSMFFFFSLALAKRHTEIIRSGNSETHSLSRRGYRIEDGPLTLVLGVSTAVASLLIMVLFIVEEVLQRDAYSDPKVLWGVPVLLAIWVGRIWLLAHRGEMNDDPVSFALRDKVSLLLGVMVAVLFIIAL